MSILDIFRITKIKQENERLKNLNAELTQKMDDLGVNDYYQTKQKIEQMEQETSRRIYDMESSSSARLAKIQRDIDTSEGTINKIIAEINELQGKRDDLQEKNEKLQASLETQRKKISRAKELYKRTEYVMDNFINFNIAYSDCKLSQQEFEELELISPSVILKLHCMDVKSLRKAYRDNERQINKVLKSYAARYTTKANKSIYNLMVIALRAELQNILYNLKYDRLEKSVEDVKKVTAKYLQIAGEGNQNIAGTLTRFIGEIEYLFINTVKIEYNYYVKKEQARQEQLAIRAQMRQEAEERKALEAERKKVEQEENKFKAQISLLTELFEKAEGEEVQTLKNRILELQAQLADIVIKKEEITNLQNGKAGNVYIISNLGSFGDNVFKIGMTRRLDPQERVNELGDASVPFKFDVHSFIFSNDAVSLEKELHRRLNNRRVNKVNLRREFFRISVDELEALVNEIEPTAEFNKTMMAEEFRQSESSDEVYTSEYEYEDEEEE